MLVLRIVKQALIWERKKTLHEGKIHKKPWSTSKKQVYLVSIGDESFDVVPFQLVDITFLFFSPNLPYTP